MTTVVGKGALLEEVVRAYFSKQGFYALRSVRLSSDNYDVTDIDIWLYSRQSASVRNRIVVDCKNKKTPKALERILWAKGLQKVVGADRAIVVTTDSGEHIAKFAFQNNVSVLTKNFLMRLEKGLPLAQRVPLEELLSEIRAYRDHKLDGDWIAKLEDCKSGLVSLSAFPSFNRALTAFAFFSQRIESKPHYSTQARRCAMLAASVACISLDMALERVTFDEQSTRYKTIVTGVTYGDSADNRTQRSIENVLNLIEQSMENGRVIAKQSRSHIERRFSAIRADILAEYFSREHHSSQLMMVGKELEEAAHALDASLPLSTEAKSVLGIFADFSQIPRTIIINNDIIKITKDEDIIEDKRLL